MNLREEGPFIAMELIQGETLRHMLQRSALAPSMLPAIARAIAEGLAEAHRCGICHHDITPANVKLDTRSCVKILDFGLSGPAQPPASGIGGCLFDPQRDG